MDEFLSRSENETSELSEIPEDIHDEEENEIPEYIECVENKLLLEQLKKGLIELFCTMKRF